MLGQNPVEAVGVARQGVTKIDHPIDGALKGLQQLEDKEIGIDEALQIIGAAAHVQVVASGAPWRLAVKKFSTHQALELEFEQVLQGGFLIMAVHGLGGW